MVHDQHGDISRLAYFQGQQVQSEYSTRGAVRKMSYTARCLRWTQSCSKSFVKEVVGLLEMSDVILVRGTKRWTLDIIYCPPFWLWTSWGSILLLSRMQIYDLWECNNAICMFFFLVIMIYHNIWDFLDVKLVPPNFWLSSFTAWAAFYAALMRLVGAPSPVEMTENGSNGLDVHISFVFICQYLWRSVGNWQMNMVII